MVKELNELEPDSKGNDTKEIASSDLSTEDHKPNEPNMSKKTSLKNKFKSSISSIKQISILRKGTNPKSDSSDKTNLAENAEMTNTASDGEAVHDKELETKQESLNENNSTVAPACESDTLIEEGNGKNVDLGNCPSAHGTDLFANDSLTLGQRISIASLVTQFPEKARSKKIVSNASSPPSIESVGKSEQNSTYELKPYKEICENSQPAIPIDGTNSKDQQKLLTTAEGSDINTESQLTTITLDMIEKSDVVSMIQPILEAKELLQNNRFTSNPPVSTSKYYPANRKAINKEQVSNLGRKGVVNSEPGTGIQELVNRFDHFTQASITVSPSVSKRKQSFPQTLDPSKLSTDSRNSLHSTVPLYSQCMDSPIQQDFEFDFVTFSPRPSLVKDLVQIFSSNDSTPSPSPHMAHRYSSGSYSINEKPSDGVINPCYESDTDSDTDPTHPQFLTAAETAISQKIISDVLEEHISKVSAIEMMSALDTQHYVSITTSVDGLPPPPSDSVSDKDLLEQKESLDVANFPAPPPLDETTSIANVNPLPEIVDATILPPLHPASVAVSETNCHSGTDSLQTALQNENNLRENKKSKDEEIKRSLNQDNHKTLDKEVVSVKMEETSEVQSGNDKSLAEKEKTEESHETKPTNDNPDEEEGTNKSKDEEIKESHNQDNQKTLDKEVVSAKMEETSEVQSGNVKSLVEKEKIEESHETKPMNDEPDEEGTNRSSVKRFSKRRSTVRRKEDGDSREGTPKKGTANLKGSLRKGATPDGENSPDAIQHLEETVEEEINKSMSTSLEMGPDGISYEPGFV